MNIAKLCVALAAAMLALAACANQKEPAEKALAQAESSLAEIRTDAAKYAADQLTAVDASVARLKGELEKKNYQAVVIGAPSVISEVGDLKQAVVAKKAEMESTLAAAQAEWTDLSGSVPQMVQTIETQVAALSKSHKLPKNVDKAAFDAAKTEFEAMKTEWTEAGSQFAAGEAADAVRKARNAKAKGEEIMSQLGMKNG